MIHPRVLSAAALWTGTLLFGALAPDAHAAVLRCVSRDGHVTYQDKSCPDGLPGQAVDATPNRGFRFATPEQIAKASRPPPEERPPPRARVTKTKAKPTRRADERRFIMNGMSATEVRRKYGAPDEITNAWTDSGKKKTRVATRQWVYLPAPDDPQTTTVLTMRGNMVVHVERKVTP